jgi:hypothetical protein
MSKPLVITVPHRFTKQEARARIDGGLGQIRSQLSGFASSVEDQWNGDRLDFRLKVMGQSVTGAIEPLDQEVRIEVHLPGVLGWLGKKLGGRIRQSASLLLDRK